jgi:hypothetical protein
LRMDLYFETWNLHNMIVSKIDAMYFDMCHLIVF